MPVVRLLRRPEVEARTGLSRSSIYAMMERGEFPRPRRIGQRAVAWDEATIEDWLATRAEADPRDRPRPAAGTVMQRTSLTAEEIAAGLGGGRRNGQGWMACCPAHDDHHPSLALTDREGGGVLVHCHAGCPQDDVIKALRQRGLWQNPEAGLLRETTYTYQYADGTPAFHIHRTDYPDGGKKIVQQLPDGQWKAHPPPRPLFNLPDILKNPDAPVLIVEGEKTALAAAKRFPANWVVTTSAGGSKAAKQSDWRVLKGREVLIWPDNDSPGHTYAEDVKRLCEDAGARRVVIVPYPDDVRFPDGWDLADPPPKGFRMPTIHELKDATPRPQTSPGFTFTPWSEASVEPEEQVSWVVDDMLPVSGFSMMVAKPKVGKSTTVQCLAAAVVQGKPFLGRAVQQGRVAYVALEEKRSEVLRHFRQMDLPKSAPLDIHTEPAPAQALTRLREYIEEQKPALVIIDPLFLFVRFKDGNAYAEAVNQLDPVRALARETGCHILVTHHAKKVRGAGGDEVLGSTGLFGAVDCLLSMKKSRTTQQRTLFQYPALRDQLGRGRAQTGRKNSAGWILRARKRRWMLARWARRFLPSWRGKTGR